MSDLPDGVLGFEAVGEVHAEDYRTVMGPAVEAAAADGRPVRLVYLIGPRFDRYSMGAAWEDLKFGLHRVHWERVAVITDVEWMRHLTAAFGWMVPGDCKTFAVADLAQAKAWAAGGVGKASST
jgi:hypothetical protein